MEKHDFNLSNYLRITIGKTVPDRLENYKIILDSGIFLSLKAHETIKREDRHDFLNDALILFQMTMSKGISILKLAQGTDYKNDIESLKHNKAYRYIEPTAISSLTRTQFEAFSNFHNIYNSSDDDNVKQLLHDLWVVAGLKERQRFIHDDMAEEHKKKAEVERRKIDTLIERIEANEVFLSFSEERAEKLRKQIKQRNFQFVYKDGDLKKSGWRDMFLNAGIKPMFENIYSNMSLYSHPSNVSVFQFAQMFDEKTNTPMTHNAMNISRIIMALFIGNYCKFIPEAHAAFQELPRLYQFIIDFENKAFRETEDFIISNEHEDQIAELESQVPK